MNKIRVAVIGVGHLGSRHLKIYHELRDLVSLAGICDTDPSRCQELAQQYHVPVYHRYTELADKVDAVNICVPTVHHHEIAKFFLENGTHTLVEKPMTITLAEADELVALAQKKKLKLQIGHVERFNSAFLAIQHFTNNPLFIECHRLNPFPHRSLDIGVVMDLMIHDIDIVLGLNSSPIESIQAIGVNVLTRHEDIANARLTFSNGCVCNLTASRISDEPMRKIRIFLPETYISLDYVKQEAFIYKKHASMISKHALPIEKEEPLKQEIASFIECVKENKRPLVSGAEGREALKVAIEICRQIADRKPKK